MPLTRQQYADDVLDFLAWILHHSASLPRCYRQCWAVVDCMLWQKTERWRLQDSWNCNGLTERRYERVTLWLSFYIGLHVSEIFLFEWFKCYRDSTLGIFIRAQACWYLSTYGEKLTILPCHACRFFLGHPNVLSHQNLLSYSFLVNQVWMIECKLI